MLYAPPQVPLEQKTDFRVYLGIVLFRWQIITLCFLWALLIGVLYINWFASKEYLTHCKLMINKDPNLQMGTQGTAPMAAFQAHLYLLQSDRLRRQAAQDLYADWAQQIGSLERMMLPVESVWDRAMGSTLNVSIRSSNPGYTRSFLERLLVLHEQEWKDIQRQSTVSATKVLGDELTKLEEKIKASEDSVIEYKRLNDIARVEAKSSMESRYLEALMSRRNQLSTELMLLTAANPSLKGAPAAVIRDIADITRETGELPPVRAERMPDDALEPDYATTEPALPKNLAAPQPDTSKIDLSSLLDRRVTLGALQQKEKELSDKFKPEHPELVAVRRQITDILAELDLAAQIESSKIADRSRALKVALSALETAEYTWKSKNMLASEKRAELRRLQDVVERYESNYRLLYERLHELIVSEELKAEHFRLLEPVTTDPVPIWPDPLRIVLMSLVLGLGSGFGLAILAQFFDNKVQTIRDVESELGMEFLGGIPFWSNSGLEETVRPIVTEEHSVGAVEAYRSLRTMILAAMAKQNENILLMTSANSKEGKTLTSLNMAVMIAQMGRRVLLIDLDLRRGRLHKSLGFDKEPGFTDLLNGQRSAERVIIKTTIPNLDFIPTGANVDNAAELLHSVDIKQQIQALGKLYDYVLIDTSPVLRVTDTVIVANQGFGVMLFVTHVNRTPKPMIKYALGLLKDAKILGMIINGIEMHRISSMYYAYQYPNYAYYSNAYRYGYDSYNYGDEKKGKPHRRKQSWILRRKAIERWFQQTFLPME